MQEVARQAILEYIEIRNRVELLERVPSFSQRIVTGKRIRDG